jgi:dihydrodipicolinate synthase/N-acetylneuraminate lyase
MEAEVEDLPVMVYVMPERLAAWYSPVTVNDSASDEYQF